MYKKVAVVILNWNGLGLLKQFLPEVIATSPEARIVVADNGSTDNSVDWVRATYPEEVDIIAFDKNYGFARGYNMAVAQIDEPLVVLLNSDVAPAEGWLKPLVEMMESDINIAACQPRIMQVADHDRYEYAGAAGGFLDRNGYPYCRGRVMSHVESDHGQYSDPIEIDWASGAALMTRPKLYIKAGGLDEHFFAHMEEIDLCWRFRLMGYKLMAEPDSTVYHLGGGSLAMGSPRKTYLNFRNNLLMLYKNLPKKIRRKKLIERRLLDTLAWTMNVVTGKWGHAGAIMRAHNDYRRMVKNIYKAEVEKLDNENPDRRNLLENRPNLLTSYYLRRHKTFSSIHSQTPIPKIKDVIT
ncbi:MAG: glycosyltransferase family 2 protein [Muribaculaceae bacterium]|nr:glycosyltransferase family 2 protein [Muribaculaceae bacterium]